MLKSGSLRLRLARGFATLKEKTVVLPVSRLEESLDSFVNAARERLNQTETILTAEKVQYSKELFDHLAAQAKLYQAPQGVKGEILDEDF